MKIWALIKRICRQMIREKRTLALLFVAPLFILTLMYFLFRGEDVKLTLGVEDGTRNEVVEVLEKADIDVNEYDKVTEKAVVHDNLDGFLYHENNEWNLLLQNQDPTRAKTMQMKLQAIMEKLPEETMSTGGALSKPIEQQIKIDYVYGDENTEFFDTLNPVLVGYFVFFFVFLISGIGLLKERTTGTLERLLATPIKRWEIVAAYLIGYGMFAVIQTLIVVLYSIHVLDMMMVGFIGNVILVNLLLALVALSLGTLLSSFAASEFQMMQFIPIVIVPQIFFAGIFPLEGLATWLQLLGRIFPIYYASDALKGVMYKGQTIGEIAHDLYALSLFAIVFIILNVFALKKYRKL